MKKIVKFFTKPKNWILSVLVVFVISFLVVNPFIKPIDGFETSPYPEEEYKKLETEIERMIESGDFTSKYEFEMRNNIEENIYIIEMKNEKASVTAEIKDSKSFSIKREVENEEEHIEKQNKIVENLKKRRYVISMLCSSCVACCVWVVLFTLSIVYEYYYIPKKSKENEIEN